MTEKERINNKCEELEMLEEVIYKLDTIETDESDDAMYKGYYEEKLEVIEKLSQMKYKIECES